MDILPLQPRVRADQLPLERLAGNPHLSEKEKVAEVARQFESVLVRQILAEARKSVHSEGLGENNPTLDIYHDLVNRALADSISRSGTLGLATSLQSQLTRQTVESTSARPEPEP